MSNAGHAAREFLLEHSDIVLLAGIAAVVLATGIGLRDPWPSDEPRFAAIARDMLATGDWLFPRIGGDLYADKPPVFFWLQAVFIWLTGSVRVGFMLPPLIAGFVTLAAVFDLGRRLFDRRTAVIACLLLLCTLQFANEFRSAQIDPVLAMLTTLGLYGLLRHMLLGPHWRWCALGGLACGIGVATKGVGFLPLLSLPLYAVLVGRGWKAPPIRWRWRWGLAPLATVIGICCWLVPMLIAVALSDDPSLRGYRDEILFGQTVDRYVSAEGHLKPPWYFVTNVIPWAWLPITPALPWLIRPWRDAIRAKDLRIGMLLGWVGLVLLFFSMSSGKRGVYILPALPALALATAPYVTSIWRVPRLQTVGLALLGGIATLIAVAFIYLQWIDPAALGERLYGATITPAALVLPIGVLALVCLVVAWRRRRGLGGLAAFLYLLWPILGVYTYPAIDGARSGRIIMDHAYAALPGGAELGIIAQKESLLLQAHGTLTNFGHRRPDSQQEQYDGARWLAGRADRYLIIRTDVTIDCFDLTAAADLGYAHGSHWLLVAHTAVAAQCADLGAEERAIEYRAGPPEARS